MNWIVLRMALGLCEGVEVDAGEAAGDSFGLIGEALTGAA